MELVQGMRNKKELKLLKEYLKNWSIKVIQISENISTKAMFFVEDYYLSHSMELADALMAATAIDSNEVLLTGNGKQYDFIPNLEIIRFRQ
jgi:predicted nucleic acid-binding protein